MAVTLFSAQSNAFAGGAVTYELTWSGAYYENSATATAFMTVDPCIFPDNASDYGVSASDLGITALTLTIQNASSGNGVFTLADFTNSEAFNFDTVGATLDLSQELVGQQVGEGIYWGAAGSNGEAGDFNLFGDNEGDPAGEYYFDLGTDGGFGDQMTLTSFEPIPEPSMETGIVALLGLSLLIGYRRFARAI